ncbi:MAG: hypothetical protein K6F09_01465 [Clostridiales bacterium]|nr:hypothetical protein [Clostridiales bacterium]
MESVRKKVEMPYGIKFAFLQGVCFAASFLLGRVKLLGLLPTFAVSLASSAPGVYAVSAAAGAAAGCAASAGR